MNALPIAEPTFSRGARSLSLVANSAIPAARHRQYNILRYLWENGWLNVRFERYTKGRDPATGGGQVVFFGRLRNHEEVLAWIEVPTEPGEPWRLWSGPGRDCLLGEHDTLQNLVNAEISASVDLYDDLANGRIPMEGNNARIQA